MKRLLIFDLDGTLCPYNGPMTTEDIEALRQLEREGYKIAVCSGKPVYYLCGFMRQVGLVEPILAGENGSMIQFGIVMPNDRRFRYPVSDRAKAQIARVKARIDEIYQEPDVWYQPNDVELTPFVREEGMLDVIAEAINDLDLSELNVYRFFDCFDFVPNNISKGNSVKYMAELVGVDMADVIVFGDADNDVSMFDVAGVSVKIGDKLDYEADYCFEDLSQALAKVREM